MLFDSPVSAQTYSVTFTESGLPSGTAWSVTLATVGTVFSSTSSIVFSTVSPGTYSYTIANASTPSCSNLCTYHPTPSTGSVVVSTSNVGVSTSYTERYYLTVVGGSGGSNGQGWYYVGTPATASSAGVFGRGAGVGSRITSYNVDGGTNTMVSTSSTVQVPVTMSAAHTVTFNKVTQYQVTLDSGAVTALASISAPTLAGDKYWYDSGSAVSLILSGAWGRSGGTGTRLKSFELNGGASVAVAANGPVTVLDLASITSPEFVTTSLTTQYQLTLDSGAGGALFSITPTPINGDYYWYDYGTVVQYVGQGVFDRSDGAGMRMTDWWFDSNAQNPVATSGVFSASVAMYATHTLHTSEVTQYEVSLSGRYSIYSITPPTLTGDDYWYDKGSSVNVIMNGTFGRVGGTGNRMTGYSVNGGQSTPILTTSQVLVLSLTDLSSPQTVAVSSTAQVEVSLDSTSLAALSYITPPTIPGDAYWYDAGISVSLNLNGVWARSSGTGLRLSSYSLNGGSPVVEATTAVVVVLNEVPITSPQSLEATDQVQYQLTVHGGSDIAYTVPPAIQGDTGWYDSGTSLQVSSSGIYARSAGVGQRVAWWNLDGGPANEAPASGEVTTSLITMSTAHTVDFGSVTQYQVTLDEGASESLRSISSPTIGGDDYWYDSGSAVSVVLNVTGPIGPGARYHLVAYAINEQSSTPVPQLGSVTVLNIVSLASPQSISATLATQFLLSVSGGNGATVSRASPTGDGWYDNGTTLTVTTSYAWGTVSGQSRQSLTSYALDGIVSSVRREASGNYTTPSILMDMPHSLRFNSVTQYYVTFVFTDSSGTAAIVPSSLQLDLQGVGTITVQNESQWLDSGSTFSIASVSWHGADVTVPSVAAYLIDRPTRVNATTRVYSATIKIVDPLGLPVSGANAQITLANETVVQTQSGPDGTISLDLIPQGTFRAVVSDLGVSSTLDGDASTQASFQVGVAMSLNVILLAVVIVVIVAAGTFFLLRSRRSRRLAIKHAEQEVEPEGPQPDYTGPM